MKHFEVSLSGRQVKAPSEVSEYLSGGLHEASDGVKVRLSSTGGVSRGWELGLVSGQLSKAVGLVATGLAVACPLSGQAAQLPSLSTVTKEAFVPVSVPVAEKEPSLSESSLEGFTFNASTEGNTLIAQAIYHSNGYRHSNVQTQPHSNTTWPNHSNSSTGHSNSAWQNHSNGSTSGVQSNIVHGDFDF